MLPKNQKLKSIKFINKYVVGFITFVCIIVASMYLTYLLDDSDISDQKSTEELRTFAELFINTINYGSIDELMSYYNDFVQYHGNNYSLQDIRLDKENYFELWQIVNFAIDGEIEIIKKENVAEIVIPVKFAIESKKRNEAISGTATEQLIVSQIKGKWKIIAESEQIIEKSTYSAMESTTHDKAQNIPKKILQAQNRTREINRERNKNNTPWLCNVPRFSSLI